MCLCTQTTLLTHGPFLLLSSLVPCFLSLLHLKPFLFTKATAFPGAREGHKKKGEKKKKERKEKEESEGRGKLCLK